MRYLDKLSEAKKRFYTKDEVDAYARGREEATIARRQKEFKDFQDEVIRKSKEGESKEEKKKKVEEARKPSTKDILKRREKGRKYRDAMHARIKAGLDTEPAKQTGRIPGPKPGEKKLKAEAYIQLGDVLAEGMRVKVSDALKKFSRKQYRKGEVDDASGKPKRAKMRGKAANMAGKLAQKVEPKEKG